jgi:hypothetical protein
MRVGLRTGLAAAMTAATEVRDATERKAGTDGEGQVTSPRARR